jgi:hypothetical protein
LDILPSYLSLNLYYKKAPFNYLRVLCDAIHTKRALIAMYVLFLVSSLAIPSCTVGLIQREQGDLFARAIFYWLMIFPVNWLLSPILIPICVASLKEEVNKRGWCG